MYLAKILTATGPAYVNAILDGETFLATGPAQSPSYDPLPPYSGPHFNPAPLESFHLLAPVRPTKIICVGRNYKDHAAELGNDVPKEPLLFFKPLSSLLAPGATVLMPSISKRVDFEGELAIVIGNRCHKLAPDDDVAPFIHGYTLCNDVTARDIQKSDGQWTRGKGFDTFCPVGPVLALTGGSFNPLTTPVTLTTHLTPLGGKAELRQTGSTADFIFDIPYLIRYISQFLTLEPGDLIPTGTPAGVGPVASGDVVAISIPGLGTLGNPFAAE